MTSLIEVNSKRDRQMAKQHRLGV